MKIRNTNDTIIIVVSCSSDMFVAVLKAQNFS
jgi:hypothetical protein